MVSPKDSSQKPIVSSLFLTHHPEFRYLFPEIMQVLFARREDYVPERVSMGEAHGFRNAPFGQDQLDEFFQKWKEEEPGKATWIFGKETPTGLIILISDDLQGYGGVQVSVQRDYLSKSGKVEEFLTLLKKLYIVVHSMYGNVFLREMFKEIDPHRRNRPAGIDLRRGIPDIFWANFLGPEYVEMFGVERISSAPCYSVEHLPDGGALLLLSASPLDYLADPENSDKRRIEIKRHLGPEAFDEEGNNYRARVPRFRYEQERKLQRARYPGRTRGPDLLATVPRKEWKDWVESNRAIALAFVADMKSEDMKLDFSEKSLDELDRYIERIVQKGEKRSIEFVKKLGAYLTEIIIEKLGQSGLIPNPTTYHR